MQRYLSGLLLAIILLSLLPSFSLGKTRLLNVNFYFHRELSGIGNYRVLNTAYPGYSDNKSIVQTLPSGVWEIGDGWISPEVPQDITLERSYNFLFSIWGIGNGKATLFFKFYAYRNDNEHLLFRSDPSEQLIKTVSEMLWQHKTKEVTLQIREGDRLVLRLFINVTVPGTFGLGYDCTQYPSYVNDPTETRFMRDNTHTINGLLAYVLGLTQSTAGKVYAPFDELAICYWGIRVWKRSDGGTETEITSGTPVAQVSRSAVGSGIQWGFWTCPFTSLVNTDAVIVRVYFRWDTTGWVEITTFITEQLGAQSLDQALWTVYYWTQIILKSGVLYYFRFRWGTSTYDSRIATFTWTEYVPTGAWNYVSAWQFNLIARAWNQIAFWPFTLITESWKVISSWIFNLMSRIWNPISSWIFTLQARSWQNINFWIFSLRSPGWNSVSSWIFSLETLGWHSIAFWIFSLTPFSTGFLLIPLIFLVGVVLFLMAVALGKKLHNEF